MAGNGKEDPTALKGRRLGRAKKCCSVQCVAQPFQGLWPRGVDWLKLLVLRHSKLVEGNLKTSDGCYLKFQRHFWFINYCSLYIPQVEERYSDLWRILSLAGLFPSRISILEKSFLREYREDHRP
jgi:hypothetical protein